ncbi:MAG TPA: TonB-dependent receptor, partial [Sphingomonas sp.]|nr:TonB-dependent receptor [Sphingomonas sp.]
GSTSLVSASAMVRQDTSSRFDFTSAGANAARIFDQDSRIRLISNETRLSRLDAEGRGWVIGANFIQDDEKLTRAMGNPAAPIRILGVDNKVSEAALFGEAGIGLARGLVATLGGRLEYTHLVGEALDGDAAIGEPSREEKTFLPSISLSWHPNDHLLLFGRYQEGFRPGGLSITPAAGGPLIQRFHGDDLGSAEVGAKWTPAGARRLEVDLTIGHARWENIQADLVDRNGLPFSANIGSGRIWSAEATWNWRPIEALRLSAGVVANDSRLADPSRDFPSGGKYELPNIAHFAASMSAAFAHDLKGGWRIDTNVRLHYVGHSRLGVGPTLGLRQGDYSLTAASLHVGKGPWGIGIDADNLLNTRGNMFALGNPFDVAAGQQIVPLRPRTIRIGIDAHF